MAISDVLLNREAGIAQPPSVPANVEPTTPPAPAATPPASGITPWLQKPPAPELPPFEVPGAVEIPQAILGGTAQLADLVRQRGAAQQPAIEDYRRALAARSTDPALVAQRERMLAAEENSRAVAAQQPARGARAFLAPVEGENPLMALQKLVQATSLFAAGFGAAGSTVGAARAATASLTGALAGWNEGDRERGERLFEDWKAKSALAVRNAEIEQSAYARILRDTTLSLDDKATALKLAGMEFDNPILATQIELGGVEKVGDWQAKVAEATAKHAESRARIIDAHERSWAMIQQRATDAQQRHLDRMMTLKSAEERLAEIKRHNLEMEQLRRDNLALQRDKQQGGKILPQRTVDEIGEARALVAALNRASELYKPQYTGGLDQWRAWAQGKTTGLTPAETEFRTLIAGFENRILKFRSGTAVTANELNRAREELPGFGTPDSEFPTKIRVARELLEEGIRAKLQEYQDFGWKVPDNVLKPGGVPPAPPAGGPSPSPAARDGGAPATSSARPPKPTNVTVKPGYIMVFSKSAKQWGQIPSAEWDQSLYER